MLLSSFKNRVFIESFTEKFSMKSWRHNLLKNVSEKRESSTMGSRIVETHFKPLVPIYNLLKT